MKGIIEAVKAVLRPEVLDDLPVRHVEPFSVNFLSWLFGREELPRDREAPGPAGPGFLAWLHGPEELPAGKEGGETAGRRSFLGELFGGEELPHDEAPGAGPRGRGGSPPAQG